MPWPLRRSSASRVLDPAAWPYGACAVTYRLWTRWSRIGVTARDGPNPTCCVQAIRAVRAAGKTVRLRAHSDRRRHPHRPHGRVVPAGAGLADLGPAAAARPGAGQPDPGSAGSGGRVRSRGSGAAALVHRIEPHAEGSGIPRVEAVVEGRTPPGSARILPVKYLGGLLTMGAGLALGREGPSVQMGGNIAIIVSRVLRRNRYDLRMLVAAGAAAGLATAFSAPIAGGVFVLEELMKRFQPRTAVATLLASAAGFMSADLLLGGSSFKIFSAPPMRDPRMSDVPLVVVVGLLAGAVGMLYN